MKTLDVPQVIQSVRLSRKSALGHIRSWLLTFEIYPLVLIAGFLRLFMLTKTEFDTDQAMIFGMARDAVVHGLVPATSNIASVNIVNPPAVVYLLMITAAFTANPLSGAIFVALLNTLAALLTYFFVRRYFGRAAAIVAAFLYATALQPVLYSRFLWQQNMLAPFTVLFLFALFWGVFERRSGWLAPALLLLGIEVQLHETSGFLAVSLFVALVLAYDTLRWRDVILGVVALLLVFSPYIIWEFSTHFADVSILLTAGKLPAHYDQTALQYYQFMFSPYGAPPTDVNLLQHYLVRVLHQLQRAMLILVPAGFATALFGVLFWRLYAKGTSQAEEGEATSVTRTASTLWTRFTAWWQAFRTNPQRCGLLILLAWQAVPLIALSRHALPIYPHYILFFLPGPFILVGIFIAKTIDWLRAAGKGLYTLRYAVYLLTGLLVSAQLLGTGAALLDGALGNYKHSAFFNALDSLQGAVAEADTLARQRHLHHVYISVDQFTDISLTYLAQQMQTPTTVFDSSACLVLPAPTSGPAVMLVGPADTLAKALLAHYASATLVEQPPRLGGAPFQLYIVQPLVPAGTSQPQAIFPHHLQLLSPQAKLVTYRDPYGGPAAGLITSWSVLRSAPPAFRTSYAYNLHATLNSPGVAPTSAGSTCTLTALQAGDQLLMTFGIPPTSSMPASLAITASTSTTLPYNLSWGPLHLETIKDTQSRSALSTPEGGGTITVSA